MEPQSMQDLLNKAFDSLEKTKKVLFDVSENELIARENLKFRESELLMSGAIIGKNAESRQAELRQATANECDICEKLRQAKASALLAFELASMEVDRLKWLIRSEKTREA